MMKRMMKPCWMARRRERDQMEVKVRKRETIVEASSREEYMVRESKACNVSTPLPSQATPSPALTKHAQIPLSIYGTRGQSSPAHRHQRSALRLGRGLSTSAMP